MKLPFYCSVHAPKVYLEINKGSEKVKELTRIQLRGANPSAPKEIFEYNKSHSKGKFNYKSFLFKY